MSTATLASTISGQWRNLPEPMVERRGIGHYLHLAVTISLVFVVVVAGWFATMQLNQPGGENNYLALAPATPEIETMACDVDPLETETVMEIVKNPARFMVSGPTGEPSASPMVGSPPNAELWEVDPDLELTGSSNTPAEEEFDDATEYANRYLACMMYGTQGHIWTFYSPVLLQQKILAEFPVFAEESQVRERVEEMATEPAYYAELSWEGELAVVPPWAEERIDDESHRELDPDIGSVSVNPDFQLARVQQSESSYYESVMSIGISIEDVEGNQLVLTNGSGTSIIPMEFGNTGMIYIKVAKLRHSDGWVIIPWPSESELGFDLY